MAGTDLSIGKGFARVIGEAGFSSGGSKLGEEAVAGVGVEDVIYVNIFDGAAKISDVATGIASRIEQGCSD